MKLSGPLYSSYTRLSATLAENLERATRLVQDHPVRLGHTDKIIKTPEIKNRHEEAKEEEGEQFREMFLMPKRKLMIRQKIEQLTGQVGEEKVSRHDILDRMSVRTPRREEMPFDQDWPSVWPAAANFRASVVPLPIKMGSRKKPDKRPPFKTFGNLELMKIPNFLHLTPEHIRRHCEAIKKFFTPYPTELKEDPSLISEHLPVTIRYSDFVHQGTSIRDMRARVITMRVKISNLHLDDHGKDKLRRLAGNRYDERTDTLTIVTDRCFTRKQNRDYADYLLTALYHESKKAEEWEKQRQRIDNWKVEFEGSRMQERLHQLIEAKSKESSENPPQQVLNENDPAVKEFVDVWTEYRNTTETVDSARRYSESIKKLLGIEDLLK